MELEEGSTGLVVGQFILGMVDRDDDDNEPDLIGARGTIEFTPVLPYVPVPVGSPNAYTLIMDTFVGVLDDQGYLCTPRPDDPSLPGARGIRLFATDNPNASVTGWTWRVKTKFEGTTAVIPAFTIAVPGGQTVDLSTLVKVPQSAGIGTEQATTLAASAHLAARQASEHAAKAAEEASSAGVSAYDAGQIAAQAMAVAAAIKKQADDGDFRGATGPQGPPGESPEAFVPPALAMAPAEDVPQFTYAPLKIWSDTPSIAGSAGWYREKRVGAAEKVPGAQQGDTGALDITGSSYFRYPSLPNGADYAPNSGRMITSTMKPGGDAQFNYWLFNIEFVTSSPVVEFALNAASTNGYLGTVLVNGKRVTKNAVRHNGTGGAGLSAKLTFPSAKQRTITVYGLNNSRGLFGGVGVGQGYTVTKPVAPAARRIAIIGDSYVNGTNEVATTDTFAWRLARLLGADEILQAGIGGTGFVNTIGNDANSVFSGRIETVLSLNPDVVIFAGGRNDPATGLRGAVTSALSAAAHKEVYLVSTASDITQQGVNAELQAAADAVGVVFLKPPVSRLPMVADGIHLTQEGHREFADHAFALIGGRSGKTGK